MILKLNGLYISVPKDMSRYIQTNVEARICVNYGRTNHVGLYVKPLARKSFLHE